MPKVGNTEFPYTREGIAAAKSESQKTGQPVKARRSYADVANATANKQRAAKRNRPPEGSPAEEKTESPAVEAKETAAGDGDAANSLGGTGVTIKDAIKRPGALTAKAKEAGQSVDEFARAHQHDGDKTGEQARFYLGVLKKANK